MKNRTIATIALLAAGGFVLAGCSSSQEAENFELKTSNEETD